MVNENAVLENNNPCTFERTSSQGCRNRTHTVSLGALHGKASGVSLLRRPLRPN